jgi:hypothetical protein
MIVAPFLGGGNPNLPGDAWTYGASAFLVFSNGNATVTCTLSSGSGEAVWCARQADPSAVEVVEFVIDAFGANNTVELGVGSGAGGIGAGYRWTAGGTEGFVGGVGGYAPLGVGAVVGIKLSGGVASFYCNGVFQASVSGQIPAVLTAVFSGAVTGQTRTITLRTDPATFSHSYP